MTGNGLNFRWNDPRPTAEFVICFVLHFLGPCDTADINHLFTSCWRKSPGHWIYLSFTVSFATWRSWSNPCFQSLQSPSESQLPKPRHLELSQHQGPNPPTVSWLPEEAELGDMKHLQEAQTCKYSWTLGLPGSCWPALCGVSRFLTCTSENCETKKYRTIWAWNFVKELKVDRRPPGNG